MGFFGWVNFSDGKVESHVAPCRLFAVPTWEDWEEFTLNFQLGRSNVEPYKDWKVTMPWVMRIFLPNFDRPTLPPKKNSSCFSMTGFISQSYVRASQTPTLMKDSKCIWQCLSRRFSRLPVPAAKRTTRPQHSRGVDLKSTITYIHCYIPVKGQISCKSCNYPESKTLQSAKQFVLDW